MVHPDSMFRLDICFVFPGYLEALTQRGGGREERLLQVAMGLSSHFNVVIIAPFFGKYRRIIKINPTLLINNLYFPSPKDYPAKNWFAKFMQLISISFYALEAVVRIIRFKVKGLKVIVLGDIVSGILPAIIAIFLHIKVVCYEGNITPWAEP